jgi:anti-anti-sigma factor
MEYERRRDTVLARVTGELDHCSAQRVRRELDRLIADPGVKHLVLDMRDMTFMDSSGIGVLLGRYREMNLRGGTVAVQHMNPHVEKIFLMSGMRQVIQIL